MFKRHIVHALFCLGALLLPTRAPAADYTWSGGSGGSGDAWRNGNNWTPASGQGGPGIGDAAIFSTQGSATNIGINFNDGRGLVAPIGLITLLSDGMNQRRRNLTP